MAKRKKDQPPNDPPKTYDANSKKPKGKVFDAAKWFGCLPELAGDTLEIQRKMRAEWDREWDPDEPAPTAPAP